MDFADVDAELLRLAAEALPVNATHCGQHKQVRSRGGQLAITPKGKRAQPKAASSQKAAKAKAKASPTGGVQAQAQIVAGSELAAVGVSRKNVHSRAYHRAKSAAEKAGLGPEEAKCKAREAANEAVANILC